jgi:hypothetical protein
LPRSGTSIIRIAIFPRRRQNLGESCGLHRYVHLKDSVVGCPAKSGYACSAAEISVKAILKYWREQIRRIRLTRLGEASGRDELEDAAARIPAVRFYVRMLEKSVSGDAAEERGRTGG